MPASIGSLQHTQDDFTTTTVAIMWEGENLAVPGENPLVAVKDS